MFKWYLIIINALGLLFMIADKQRAKKKRWRYSESFLLTVAALGGSIGTLLGMFLFHHKTRKPKFSIGVPILLIIQLILILLCLYTAK
jgi:uncharacterized membrane protein YsdA (DUF1294 family)